MGKEIYYLSEQPRGWHAATAEKVRNQYAYILGESRDAAHERIKREQELCWEERTGEKPQESRFTLIMPIHNEAKAFPSAFSTLLSSDIPHSVPMEVLLITNACTDQTPRMVDVVLSRLGKPEERIIEGDFTDLNLNRNGISVVVGNRTYTHIDTAFAGKANALTIGNTLALQNGHDIAICIDANNYLESGAIGNLYGSFRQAKNKDSSVVLSSGRYNFASRKEYYVPFKGKFAGGTVIQKHPELYGALMTWDTNWINSIGGIPPVSVEDYALNVIARAEGNRLERDLTASSWGYQASTFLDRLRTRERFIRGRFQITALYPQTKEIVETELFVTKDLKGRLNEYLGWAKEHPMRVPLYMASASLWELLRYKAKKSYDNNPTNQTWELIKSTK